MHVRVLFIIIFFISNVCFSQTFDYSYIDPCTGSTKTIQVPTNGITVTYYGQINTFQPQDFNNGTFNSWATGVYNSFGDNNPCASIVGLPTAVNIAQNNAITVVGIIYSLSASMDMMSDMAGSGSTNMLSSVESLQNSTSKGNKKKDKISSATNGSSGSTASNGSSGSTASNGSAESNGSSGSTANGSSGTSASNGSTANGSSGSTTNGSGGASASNGSGGSAANGSSGSTTNGSGGASASNGSGGSAANGSVAANGSSGSTASNGSSGSSSVNASSTSEMSTGNTQAVEGGGPKTNILGGSLNSLQSSGGQSSKNGNRPTVIASSDFVAFNFRNSDNPYGGKFTGGYTSTRWDGLRSSGIMADYTSAINGPNITAFYAFIGDRKINLISATLTMGFDVRTSYYATIAVGEMRSFQKIKGLKVVYMASGSFGRVYGEPFIGTAAIAGGMYDMNITKRYQVKMLLLYVYCPYVSYYNDILLKSPQVILPIVGTNIGLTKRFKVNVNVGGAFDLKNSAMNYTVMMGTRLLL